MRKRKNHRIAGISLLYMLALLFTFALLPGKSVCAQEIQADVEIPVIQSFVLKDAQNTSVNQKAAYELTALHSSVPMPEGSEEGTFTFSLEGDGQTKISMRYGHGGVYQYQLCQTTPDAERYTYDRRIYTVSVYVSNGENGELIPQVIVQNEQNEKCEDLRFQNTYTGEKTSPESDKPEGTKAKDKADGVKTGDSTPVTAWLAMLILSFLAMTGIGIQKKKG